MAMVGYYPSQMPPHIAIGVYNRAMGVFANNFQPVDALYVVDASVTPAGKASASLYVFRGGILRATVTIDDDAANMRPEYAEYNGRLVSVADLPGQYLPL
ncbi:hypothetical protein CCMSSC00406_0010303 [Pleurotus cornucopiae]|nr:hypothetical protein CCMSSC00406_0010303 [Pleurotus cornucopiae]